MQVTFSEGAQPRGRESYIHLLKAIKPTVVNLKMWAFTHDVSHVGMVITLPSTHSGLAAGDVTDSTVTR